TKQIEVAVCLPVADLTNLTAPAAEPVDPGTIRPHRDTARPVDLSGDAVDPDAIRSHLDAARPVDLSGDAVGVLRAPSIWPHLNRAVVEQITTHQSTLVFCNSRRTAERLTSQINETWLEQQTGQTFDAGAHWPAEVTAQSGVALNVAQRLAMAHHGSISRLRRSEIEEQLKLGLLPAVVATSSLELGIDMGAVDLVLQVGAPPSVAAGLQRVGRAGHQVGAVSRGVIYPLFRGDLIPAAVTAQRMRQGLIEHIRMPVNPLDVLAQQIVAMLAMEDWTVADLRKLVCRATPYANLGERSFEAVLDMLSGRYPSAEFAELKPRLVWDRPAGRLTARPGAARLAVTSGGTIPDRGLYPVFLAGEATGSKRVGELDEEMVYESRVGDTITLGTTTWRITEITPHQVQVIPAPGLPGRLPFWHGDTPGRPAELGKAIGVFIRQANNWLDSAAAQPTETNHLANIGLNPWAENNLLNYLGEQRAATGVLPDDQTIIIERFRDELGDWRVVIHSVWGARVNAPWATILRERLSNQYGLDAQVMHSDDAIVLRLPETAEPNTDGATLELDLVVEPEQVTALVATALASSAHFAARFRQAAGRALLLPRRRPDRRQPLWQQRHRASQLLQIAAQYADFPIIHEAVRECLQDDYDVPALAELMQQIAQRQVRLVEVTTETASPFAQAAVFGYTMAFIYDGDAPLAERRAAALSLDPALLAELIGGNQANDLAQLLDPAVVLALDEELARRRPERHLRDLEDLADALRQIGPLHAEQIINAGGSPDWAEQLVSQRRVITVRLGGHQCWAAVEDAAALRDGLGVALPPGLPAAFSAPTTQPLPGLIKRYARNHGPFSAAQLAADWGLGVVVATRELTELVNAGQLTSGRLRPVEAGGGQAVEYCDPQLLTRLRRRSLAALRQQVEPVEQAVFGRFGPAWHQFGRLSGPDGVLTAIAQLAGAKLPASAIETLVLPSRVPDYSPSFLDQLITSGEVMWVGQGKGPGADGQIRLIVANTDDALLATADPLPGSLTEALLNLLAGGGAFRFDQLLAQINVDHQVSGSQLQTALWELAWAGWLTTDSFQPVRAVLSENRPAHKQPRAPAHRPLL
ncbi:MAG: winged helix DNA-binding domain-containing protein, partial [Bifidobacteriaceae bacterium]|nr:winged helix DNA-binding domain-containing protein [Bifidobacteriaceae bacterium]